MRFIKVPSKRTPPQAVSTAASATAPISEVFDAEALMAQTDDRDDSAPIGSIAAQGIQFKEVSVGTHLVKEEAERSRGMPLFDRFKSLGRGKTARPKDLPASDAVVEKRRVTLDWPEAAPVDTPATVAEEPAALESADATAADSAAAEGRDGRVAATPSAEGFVPSAETKPAGSRFSRLTARKEKSKAASLTSVEAPIRVLIGFLPEVSPKDAAEFAQGIAAKHFENLGIAYFDAFKLDNGYAYEVHEGGSGRAYLPEVIKYYKSLGAFNPEDENKVVIRTGTRAVEVSRARNGLTAVLLPEDQKPAMASWTRPTEAMRPAIHKRTGVLVAGAVVFTTGFIAVLASGTFFRLQPYDAPVPTKLERIDYLKLPLSQWPQLQASPAGRYVKALRFEKGNWRIETEAAGAATAPTPEAPGAVIASEGGATPPAAPVTP